MPFDFPFQPNVGDRVMGGCVAGGSAPLRYEWLKDGSSLGVDAAKVFNNEEMSTILIKSVNASHSGNYTCVAHNSLGSDRFTARLSVKCEVRISLFSHLIEIIVHRSSTILDH